MMVMMMMMMTVMTMMVMTMGIVSKAQKPRLVPQAKYQGHPVVTPKRGATAAAASIGQVPCHDEGPKGASSLSPDTRAMREAVDRGRSLRTPSLENRKVAQDSIEFLANSKRFACPHQPSCSQRRRVYVYDCMYICLYLYQCACAHVWIQVCIKERIYNV